MALNPNFEPRATVIHYGVEPSDEAELARRPQAGPLRILYAGRLEQRQKRVHDIPEIARRLDALGVDFRLTLAGDGEESDALRREFAPMAARGLAVFTGRLAPEACRAAMAGHHALLLCSAFEGLSLAMLEALACGLVPVASVVDSGANEALRHGENALLAPVGDVEAFAQGLARLARDRDMLARLSAAARAGFFRDGFDAGTMAEGYVTVLAAVAREVLDRSWRRPEPLAPHAEFSRISLPPWRQLHPDLWREPGLRGWTRLALGGLTRGSRKLASLARDRRGRRG